MILGTVEKLVRLAERVDGIEFGEDDVIRVVEDDVELEVIETIGRVPNLKITLRGTTYGCNDLLIIAADFINRCFGKDILFPDIDPWGWQVKVHNGYYEEPQVIEIECTDWDS